MAYSDADWASCPDIAVLHSTILFILVTISFLGVPKSNLLSRTPAVNLNIVLLPRLLLNLFGSHIFCMTSRFLFRYHPYSYVTKKMLFFFWALISFLTRGQTCWTRLSFLRELLYLANFAHSMYLPIFKLLTSSQKVFLDLSMNFSDLSFTFLTG